MPADSRNKDAGGDASPTVDTAWLVVRVSAPEEVRSSMAAALIELGGGAVEEEPDGALATWLPLAGEAASAIDAVRSELRSRFGERVRVSCRMVPGEDWLRIWRRGLRPRRVGEHIVVAPSWTPVEPAAGDVLIVLDPEMAFGTGEHGSTRTALRLLEEGGAGRRVLDIGSGTGILSIVAARLGSEVLALEADEEAVRTAARNLQRNGVADRVRLVHLCVDRAILELLRGSGFDRVLVNIERSFAEPLLPTLAALLREDGRLIVAGILEAEAAGLVAVASAQGLAVSSQTIDDGWWAGAFTLATART